MNKNVLYNNNLILCIDSVDVAVVGGGLGGFSAAVTAANLGLKTLIIERSGQLGGTATLAGVANFCTSGDAVEGHGPVWDVLIDTMRGIHAIGEEYGYKIKYNDHIHTVDYSFSPSALAPCMLYLAEKNGVQLLFQTDVVDTIVEDGFVKYIIIHNESLLQAIECKYVIDASGDGIVSLHSGGKALPVDEGNNKPIPPAFRIFLHKSSTPNPVMFDNIICQEPLPYAVQYLPDDSVVLKINLRDVSTTDAELRNQVELYVKRRIPATVKDFCDKNGREYCFDGVPALLAVREGKRIEGEYVLTSEDVRAGKTFDDGIATANFIIDTFYEHEVVPTYEIPYRCLLVKNTKNLMVVGRCFSADRYAMSSSRIMITACKMGQAAGAAAAISQGKGIDLRSVPAKDILSKINGIQF